jgi:acetoacetyl-CoA reductase
VDRVVLITGGIGDIGTAIVKALSPHFHAVFALDIASDDEGRAWIDGLEDQHKNVVYYRKMDVTHFEECQQVIGSIIDEFGRVDGLVNNAGITRDAVFHKMTKKQWDNVLSVNLDGVFNATKAVVDSMRHQQYGRIINISSVNAQQGQFSQANYAASKAGMYGFTKSLAQELIAKDITVNSISPGYVV